MAPEAGKSADLFLDTETQIFIAAKLSRSSNKLPSFRVDYPIRKKGEREVITKIAISPLA